ncbi:hypothetical protein PR202_ga30247 [Eleusine coracana subsp. coracana]|uniref:C2 domain-containing protein n=1 Tax=Eleusine coracana subsp. coracana TaxID=191504 RepID=A0AAV5DNS5_ELECO|nr:hypothetical protein PR202_ga30247 [Eleusine coracana subsp. coracana]
MAHRELELTLLSARDLKSVNLFTRMDVYAVASISGDPMTRQCTPTDTSGGRNPSWNATLRFSVPPSAAAADGWLHVLLRSERALGDRDIGEVVVPLAELLAGADGTGPQPPRLASYQVHTVHRGEPRGVLNVSYRLGPIVAPVDDKPQHVIAYPAPQQPFKPQNPAPTQQPYQYQNHKPQNPASQQPPYKPQNPASQQPPYKHQNSASQQPYQYQNPEPTQQPYQYQQNPPRDTYAPAQPMKPQNPGAPQQQQPYYQYHDDAYAKSQPLKPQNPGAPPQPYHHPPRDAYAPPPRHEEANGYGPTNYYMGPHTQIILGATPRSNTIPAKADDGLKPKPSYTPTQPNTSPAKTDHSWPKAVSQKHHDTPSWTNASPKRPDRPTRPQHDTKVAKPAPTQPITSQGKTDQSWPKASPQHHQDNPAWPNATTKKPDSLTRPQQHDIKVVEHVHTLTKVGSAKPDHPTRPQALEQQKNTQVSNIISARKTNDTQVGGDYARTQSNFQPGKADSTRPKEVYANTRSNGTPGKADQHQSGAGPKPVLQHDKVHTLPTATATAR